MKNYKGLGPMHLIVIKDILFLAMSYFKIGDLMMT